MSIKRLSFVIGCALITIPWLFSCNNSTNLPPEPVYTVVTEVRPVAGETINAGSTYTIQWGYPKNWQYTQVRVLVSISNKGAFMGKDITNPIDYPQSSFQWTVPADTSGDSCRIKVMEYGGNEYSYSGYFKITR
jgi:hypothetical protein